MTHPSPSQIATRCTLMPAPSTTTVTRSHTSPTPRHVAPLDLDDVATILQHRIVAGWASFVIDMNTRVGLPYPRIDLSQRILAN